MFRRLTKGKVGNNMEIQFIGADREVTGSCHYVTCNGVHFLVDCGMEQGPDLYENQKIPVNPSTIDFVLVTHAHIDHSGLLPLLYNHGFRGQVYATKATCELCNIMLKDSAHIQEFETDGITVRFNDAGHLLGSASIEIWLKENGTERKIVFSGDIGNGGRPLIKDPVMLKEADYVVMESTYGNRNHETPPDYAKLLAEVIRDTFQRGGNLVIPAFAVGRTQEMLYFIRRIKTENLLPEFPSFEVYIDSPLAVEATNIFHKNVAECFDDTTLALIESGVNPIRFDGLKVAVTSDESKMINFIEKPKVIISASGMCEAGRIRHHLKHNLWRSDSSVLFVGYQVEGTLGNALLNGVREVKLFGETVEVKAKIVNLPGISGHADKDHLTKWISSFESNVQKVFVVHGEESTAVSFAEHVQEVTGFSATAPYSGDAYDLITGACVAEGDRKLSEKKSAKEKSAANTVFDRLVAAGARLVAVIQKCKGMSNKDLGKFADQINGLTDKWDR